MTIISGIMWHWHMATAASRWRLSTDLKLLVNKWGWRNCDDGGWMFRIWESSSNSLSYPQEASPLHISEIGSWDRNLSLKDSGLVTVIHSTPCAILSKFWARLVSLSKCLKHLFRFGGSMYWMVKQLKITNNFISTPRYSSLTPCHCVIMFPIVSSVLSQ